MIGQAFDLIRASPRSHLGPPVSSECFEGLDNVGVHVAPTLLEQAAIGDLVGEGVLEGVGMVREQARLVEELGGLEVHQATV
jgi:hypothetical protein